MPWAASFGLAAVIFSVIGLVIGPYRLDWRHIALVVVALMGADYLCALALHRRVPSPSRIRGRLVDNMGLQFQGEPQPRQAKMLHAGASG